MYDNILFIGLLPLNVVEIVVLTEHALFLKERLYSNYELMPFKTAPSCLIAPLGSLLDLNTSMVL